MNFRSTLLGMSREHSGNKYGATFWVCYGNKLKLIREYSENIKGAPCVYSRAPSMNIRRMFLECLGNNFGDYHGNTFLGILMNNLRMFGNGLGMSREQPRHMLGRFLGIFGDHSGNV